MSVPAPLHPVLAGLLAAAPAEAPESEPAAASVEDSQPESDAIGNPNTPWIRRWRPQRNTFELGVFGGVLFSARNLELFNTNFTLPEQGFKPFESFTPEFGGRLGYYPLRFLGVEAEGTYGLGSLRDDTSVGLWTVRGQVVARLPRWSVTPFILAGGGLIGVASSASAVGNDVDPMLHVGGGFAFHITRGFALRIEARDVITPSQGNDGGATNSAEALLGIAWTRRPRNKDAVVLRGEQPIAIEASAPVVEDADGDGFVDDEDACPQEAGVAPNGCPDLDADQDGVPTPDDKCPQEPGSPPDGCPLTDTDGDGMLDPDDTCPQEAETYNNYQDDDGCPDEMPEDLAGFTGTINGVHFETDSATLKGKSRTKLDQVVAILTKYPKTRVEIAGHTDSTGPAEHNLELSRRRADAVRDYLVAHGIEQGRIDTRGAGPDEPVDTNKTKAGRAANRRIEFRLMH